MNIDSKTGLVGFLLTLSALNLGDAQAMSDHQSSEQTLTVEERLSRLTNTLSSIENELSASDQENMINHQIDDQDLFANRGAWGNGRGRGWANAGGGGRGWVNANRGGWTDGRGGGWVNGNNWRNGWRDGGGFWNAR
jgi:rSAM-associated Gly-rich repeat protein